MALSIGHFGVGPGGEYLILSSLKLESFFYMGNTLKNTSQININTEFVLRLHVCPKLSQT